MNEKASELKGVVTMSAEKHQGKKKSDTRDGRSGRLATRWGRMIGRWLKSLFCEIV